jgi:hypothetical protein
VQPLVQIYCHEDAKCSLKIGEQAKVRKFEGIVEAVQAARKLRLPNQTKLIVYDALGALVLESQV